MKLLLSFFFIVIYIASVNSAIPNTVKKMDSILNSRIDSIVNTYNKEINELKKNVEVFEKYRTKSEIYDQSFMEYGSWVVGIMVGMIILFGLIFNLASDQIVEKKFKENYSYYLDKFKDIEKTQEKCKDELDIIQISSKTIRAIVNNKENTEENIKEKFPES